MKQSAINFGRLDLIRSIYLPWLINCWCCKWALSLEEPFTYDWTRFETVQLEVRPGR